MQDLTQLTSAAKQVSDLYARRFGVTRDAAWYLGKMTEELGEVTSAYLSLAGQTRNDGSKRDLENEVADLLGFLLLFADWQGIDAGAAFERKWGAYLTEVSDGKAKRLPPCCSPDTPVQTPDERII
ncbi:hypothetical protein HGG73_03280 [Rhodobacteraceae bacterium R_SAG3]|nr:hypothetical protein [Rhodobacteraceae bacterium R_SAG3]